MKQSTRLLSMLLAVVMLLGVMSVAAFAGASHPLTKGTVAYDSIDNAALTKEQVGTLCLDAIDGLLADIGDTMDLSVLGTLDYTSVDRALQSLCSIRGGANIVAWMAGDIASLNFDPLKKSGTFLTKTSATAYQRADGDLALLKHVVEFVGNDTNSDIIGNIVYGIGTSNGVDLGVVNSFLDVDLDIMKLLKGLVFDNLLRASYAYPRPEDAGLYTSAVTTYNKYEKLDATTQNNIGGADTMLKTALFNLLTDPQDKVMVNEGGTMVRRWDEGSAILPDATIAQVNINNQSLLGIIDGIIQYAYEELGTIPLNHDLKKIMMDAMGVDFNRIYSPSSALVASAPDEASTDNYFCEAAFWKYNGNYYFRDETTENLVIDGVPQFDANGVNITTTFDRYYVADISGANQLFRLVNWDYQFTGATYDFAANLTTYGSIFGQLNHLLYTILDTAISADVKAEIKAFLGTDTFFIDGDNTNIAANLLNTAKYVLCNYTKTLFGQNADYVDKDGNALATFVIDVKACTTVEDLVAYIALPLFDDIMPELIMPASFTNGLQVEQLGALALREAISDLVPAVNYDSQIFVDGSMASAGGRVLQTKTSDQWQNLILDMALDLAMTYLDNVTNININSTALANLKKGLPEGVHGWQAVLEEIVDWGVCYVGAGSSGALVGLSPSTLGVVRGTYNGNAFANVSTALNAILPLGFLCVGVDGSGNLNVETLVWSLYDDIADLDVAGILSIFGRNGGPKNLLSSDNFVTTVIKLLNQVLNVVVGKTVFASTASLDAALLTQANLDSAIVNLLRGLNARKDDLLNNVLPVVSQFISDWGGEQELATPAYSIATNFNGSTTLGIKNASTGVWRHGYMKDGTEYHDNQYKYQITAVTSATSGVSVTNYAGTLDFGGSTSVTVSETVAADTLAQLKVSYYIIDEDGNQMGGKLFTDTIYVVVNPNPAEAAPAQVTKESETGSSTRNRFTATLPGYIFFCGSVPAIGGSLSGVSYSYQRDANSFGTLYNGLTGVVVTGSCTFGGLNAYGLASYNFSQVTDPEQSFNARIFNGDNMADNPDSPLAYGRYSLTGTLTFPPTGSGGKTRTSTNTIVVYYFNGGDQDALRDLVQDCFSANRIQAGYYTDNVVADVKNPDGTTTETTINGTDAWNAYVSALNTAAARAYQMYNSTFNFDLASPLQPLKDAITTLEYCKLSDEDLATSGAENTDAAVDQIAAVLASQTVGSYKDYMLYRWDRYSRWVNSANNMINMKKAAAPHAVDTTYVPNARFTVSELTTKLSGDAYAAYILATQKHYTDKQLEGLEASLAAAKTAYNKLSSVEAAKTLGMLSRTYARLLPREGGDDANSTRGYIKAYLQTEYNSAVAVIGNSDTTNTLYTEQSWNKYLAALATAADQLENGTSNGPIFDAKYELQRARNDLILIADGADYTEANELIAATDAILANLSLYSNSTNAEIGAVLAAYGYVKNGEQLFNNSVKGVLEAAYTNDDQHRIDYACDVLRLALANLKYESSAVQPAPAATEVAEVAPIGGESSSYYAKVSAKTATDVIANQLVANTTATNANPVVVSGADLAGTGTIISIYADVTIGGTVLHVPVISYTVVVNGDVDGSSVVDAIDAMLVELTANNFRTLDGAYLEAGLLDAATAADGISAEDLSAVLELIVG